jgi:NADH-quinone oxidoreductase subunit A
MIVGILMVCITLFLSKLLSPNKPNAEKLTSYECGEEPVGSAWIPFNTRFYVIALIFLLFDVEMVFIFPWATVYANSELIAADSRWGIFTLIEMFAFAGILILGLVYVWRKGDLEWIKPIPLSFYAKLNEQQQAFKINSFESEDKVGTSVTSQPIIPVAATVKKPMFKPSFKKPSDE